MGEWHEQQRMTEDQAQPPATFWQAQSATLAAANAALTSRRQELEAKITLLETQLSEQARLYTGQLDALHAQVQTLTACLDSIYRSNIWRWSRPYVSVRQWLHRWRRPRPAPPAAPVPADPSAVPADLQVTVIVQVRQDLAVTRRCLASLLASTPPATVVVMAAPEVTAAVRAYLEDLAAAGAVVLDTGAAADAVSAVNRQLALSAESDVVLLSGAVEVAGDWLARLARCAYAGERIGLVTPFTTQGLLSGYPQPDDSPAAELDALFAEANAGRHLPLLPSGSACLYLRRACLHDVGSLDAVHFSSGGAEIDWALRAAAAGWQQTLCADTFVADLSDTGTETVPEALHRLYPAYAAQWRAACERDPAAPLRQPVDLLRLARSPRRRVLFITHNRGGGTEKHVRELARLFTGQLEVLVLRPDQQDGHTLTWLRDGERFRLAIRLPEHYAPLCELLRTLSLQALHIHHTIDLDPRLRQLPAELGLPYDCTVHDYYPLCPQINLTTAQSRYCGEPDEAGCNRCLTITPSAPGLAIQHWREQHGQLLSAARRVFAPSADVAARLTRYFPQAPILYAPHPDLDAGPATPPPEPVALPLATTEPLRIVVLGALNPIKGADLLEACAVDAQTRGLPLEFHLLGYAYRPLVTTPHSRLVWYGPYTDAQLPTLLTGIRAHLAWFPAQWPETYSYTLSACLQTGLPVAAPDLGAFPERLYGRPWTWIQPWHSSALSWNNLFMALRERHFLPATPPAPPPGTRPAAAFSYADYLPAESAVPSTPSAERLLEILNSLQSLEVSATE